MAIVKVMCADPTVNRIQDNVRDTVNPALCDISSLLTRVASLDGRVAVLEEYVPWDTYTTTIEPTASASYAGKVIIVKDPGQPSIVKVCVQNSAGGYEWVGIAQSS